MQDLRNALYAHLQRMPLRFFTATRTGEIQSRLANDVGGVQAVVTDTAASITSNVAIAISTMLAMFLLDWQLTLLSLGILPFFLYLTYRVGKVRREVSSETQKRLADMSAVTEETLSVSGILLGKTFGAQERSMERFRLLNLELARLQIRQAMVGRWFFAIIGTIFSIMPAFVYWLAGTMAASGNPAAPTAGDIVAFTTLQSRLFFPMGQLLNVQVEIQGSLALFDRIFEYLDLDPEITDAPDAVALEPADVRGAVAFEGVSFRYPAEPAAVGAAAGEDGEDAARTTTRRPTSRRRPTRPRCSTRSRRCTRSPTSPFGLEDVSFEARPGELVALVGPSGAGKTTTTYLIPRLYDVEDGRVTIDGIDVRGIQLASLGRLVGFVTQETYLFHASIRENLLFARPDATDEQLEAATRAAAILDRIAELPDGLDTDRRRARLQAVRRREAADRDRAGAAQGPADPDPGRGDVLAGHRVRAADPGGPRAAHRGADDDRDRPPPVHDPARGPDPGLRARADRRARHAPRADRARRPLRAAVPRAVRGRGGEPRGGVRGRVRTRARQRSGRAREASTLSTAVASRLLDRASCDAAERRVASQSSEPDPVGRTGVAAGRRPRRASRCCMTMQLCLYSHSVTTFRPISTPVDLPPASGVTRP